MDCNPLYLLFVQSYLDSSSLILTMYDINLRDTTTTTTSIRGVQIPIDLAK